MTGIEKSTQSIVISSNDLEQRQVTASLIRLYNLQTNMDDIVPQGIKVNDISGRSVGVAFGTIRGSLVHTGEPYADIMVIGTKAGMLLGWIHAEKMTDANDRFLVSVKALNPMPSKFDFAQPCPHMSVYGGYLDIKEDNWRCFGCDKIIPFIG